MANMAALICSDGLVRFELLQVSNILGKLVPLMESRYSTDIQEELQYRKFVGRVRTHYTPSSGYMSMYGCNITSH